MNMLYSVMVHHNSIFWYCPTKPCVYIVFPGIWQWKISVDRSGARGPTSSTPRVWVGGLRAWISFHGEVRKRRSACRQHLPTHTRPIRDWSASSSPEPRHALLCRHLRRVARWQEGHGHGCLCAPRWRPPHMKAATSYRRCLPSGAPRPTGRLWYCECHQYNLGTVPATPILC
jgi:hypothetical protein